MSCEDTYDSRRGVSLLGSKILILENPRIKWIIWDPHDLLETSIFYPPSISIKLGAPNSEFYKLRL